MERIEVDVAVVGAGTAGLNARREVERRGGRALLIESSAYGTTCARVGCMPSKLLIAAAEAAHSIAAAPAFGVHAGDVRIDGPAVMQRVQREREDFARGLRQLQALRSVFARHAQAIGDAVGPDVIRRHLRDSRDVMRASHFSTGLRDGMGSLIGAARADFEEAARHLSEVATMMNAMYRSFSSEHGLSLGNPVQFSMRRYLEALDRIEQLHRRQFGAMSLVTTAKYALMRKFFESVAVRMRALYEKVARDSQTWQRAVMTPIETQVREHQAQLRRRAEAVQRVFEASDSLEARIAEVDAARAVVEREIAAIESSARELRALLEPREELESPAGAG